MGQLMWYYISGECYALNLYQRYWLKNNIKKVGYYEFNRTKFRWRNYVEKIKRNKSLRKLANEIDITCIERKVRL